MRPTIPLYLAIVVLTSIPSSNSSHDIPKSHLRQGTAEGLLDSEEDLTYHDVLTRITSFVKNTSVYNMHVLPHKVLENGKPRANNSARGTNVSIWANVIYVGDITPDMDFSVDMYLTQEWIDHRLANLLPEPFSTIAIYGNLIDNFWIPMTIIRNGKGTIVPNDPSRNRVLRLFRDGRISYKIRIETTCWCTLDLSDYPFDNQTCEVIFEQCKYINQFIITEEEENYHISFYMYCLGLD
jgi:hypothetical protein